MSPVNLIGQGAGNKSLEQRGFGPEGMRMEKELVLK